MKKDGVIMYIAFASLPKDEQEYILNRLNLSHFENEMLKLRYVRELSYDAIAAELNVSPKSVGSLLTKARKRMVEVASSLYELLEERARKVIDKLGWRELSWEEIAGRKA